MRQRPPTRTRGTRALHTRRYASDRLIRKKSASSSTVRNVDSVVDTPRYLHKSDHLRHNLKIFKWNFQLSRLWVNADARRFEMSEPERHPVYPDVDVYPHGRERWPDGPRTLAGRSVAPEDLQLWTKPPAAE